MYKGTAIKNSLKIHNKKKMSIVFMINLKIQTGSFIIIRRLDSYKRSKNKNYENKKIQASLLAHHYTLRK